MLAEFIGAIRDLSVRAAFPHIKDDVTKNHLLIWPDGRCEIFHGEPIPRDHSACDLTAICAASQEDKDDLRHSVWYSRKSVVLLYEHFLRQDRMTLTLNEHPVLVKLRELEQAKPAMTHAQFVQMFRVYFEGYAIEGNLLETIRRITFRKNEEGESEIRHGRASLGKTLQAELCGVAEIPESVILDIPIFAGQVIPDRASICCVIDIDPAKQTFQMYPFPGEIDLALWEAEQKLRDRLVEGCAKDARIYYGTP